ncbi:hypothetical protein HBH47_148810 [Parastagonospora nodorum]|nr:hypothetical protein HBH47_148810 [Parastagonospora nodorum]
MEPYQPPLALQKCRTCHHEYPSQNFFRAGGRTTSQYWKSCNGCAEKAASSRIKATQRTTYLDRPSNLLPGSRGATFTDYRGLPPSLDPDRDMRVATGLPVRLVAETVPPGAPVHGQPAKWMEHVPVFQPEVEQHKVTPFIDTLIGSTELPSDLLRCASILSCTPTSACTFRAQFFIQQYTLAIRLSKLCKRWKQIGLQDWYNEVSTMCSISTTQYTCGATVFLPWPPLASWLETFKAVMSTAIEENSGHDELAQRALYLVNQLHRSAELKKGQCHRGIAKSLQDTGTENCGYAVTNTIRKIEEYVEEDCARNGILAGLSFTANSVES